MLQFRKFAAEVGQNPDGTAETGKRRLETVALLLSFVTTICWLLGCVQPVVLVPVYLVLALCLYEKKRPARLLLAVTMLLHLTITLLRFFFGIPIRLIPKTVMLTHTVMQLVNCLFYLGTVMYLYSSPSIAAYYQENETC